MPTVSFFLAKYSYTFRNIFSNIYRNGYPLVFFLVESHGQRSLVGYCPWGLKELDTTEQLTNTFTFFPPIFLTETTGQEKQYY